MSGRGARGVEGRKDARAAHLGGERGSHRAMGGKPLTPPRPQSHLTQLLFRLSSSSSPSYGGFWKIGELLNPQGALRPHSTLSTR